MTRGVLMDIAAIKGVDYLELEELAKEGANRKRWDFMLTASPMAIAGGTGSPLNPIATF